VNNDFTEEGFNEKRRRAQNFFDGFSQINLWRKNE
jgi:hypothetical protein